MTATAQKASAQPRPSAIRQVNADQVKAYDFRAAAALDTSHVSQISAANEAFARNLSECFTRRFEMPCEIAVGSVQLAASDSFVEAESSESWYFHSLLLGPHGEIGVLQIEKNILLVLLDCLMGGNGQSIDSTREMTEIESKMAHELTKIITTELQGGWKNFKIEMRVGRQQTVEELAGPLSTSTPAYVPSLTVKVGEIQGKLHLMLPIPVIASSLRPQANAKPVNASSFRQGGSSKLAAELLESTFGVELVLPKGKVRATDLLNLVAGGVLNLGIPAGSPIVADIGGRAVFSALPGRAGVRRAAQLVERFKDDAAKYSEERQLK
jgi:flagellar motor switch protein FliM